jgi:hypothetical protein
MKALTAFASAAAVAAALSVAAPVHAAVFAQFTPDLASADYKWVRNGAGTGGHFFSIVQGASTVAQGAKTHFSFLDPALAALAFLPATFKLDATVANGNPATQNAGIWTQKGVSGSFSFIYSGVTTTIAGHTLIHNTTNLLSGVFTDAWISGAGGSGSANLAMGNGGTATYTSSVEPFLNLAANTEEFAFNLLGTVNDFGTKKKPLPGFNAVGGDALDSFRANGGGNFSFQTVPEPATWGLMIVGFAGVGAMVRNRRRAAVLSA